jgi:hypothetical protein
MAASQGDEVNSRRKLIVALGAGVLIAPFTVLAQALGIKIPNSIWIVGVKRSATNPRNVAKQL